MDSPLKYFLNPSEVERRELAPGITLRIMWGEHIMMSMVEIAPKAVLPAHSHANEQGGVVLQGEFEFTIGDEKKTMRSGDAYMIPGNVEHSLVGSDGWSLCMDVFSPPREEYKTPVNP